MGNTTTLIVILSAVIISHLVAVITTYVIAYDRGREDYKNELNKRIDENLTKKIEDVYIDCTWK